MKTYYEELKAKYKELKKNDNILLSFKQFVLYNITNYNATSIQFPPVMIGGELVRLSDTILKNKKTGEEYFVVFSKNNKISLWSYEEDSDCDGSRIFSYIIKGKKLSDDLDYFANDFESENGITINCYLPYLKNISLV